VDQNQLAQDVLHSPAFVDTGMNFSVQQILGHRLLVSDQGHLQIAFVTFILLCVSELGKYSLAVDSNVSEWPRYVHLHGRRVSISRLTNKPPKSLRSVACGVYISSCHVVSNSCGQSASLSCSTYLVRVTRFVLTIKYLLFWLRALIHNKTVCSVNNTYDIGTFLWQHVSVFI
jgi:hypothetical protein